MDRSALSDGERRFLELLNDLGVRYMVVGVSAASMQGARVGTEDVDLWFENAADERVREAAKGAGGFFTSGFGMQPPAVGGNELGDRFDIVLSTSGLDSFDEEYSRSIELDVDGVAVKVLPLERIIASKRAAGRPKDIAALPALEAALAVLEEDGDDST